MLVWLGAAGARRCHRTLAMRTAAVSTESGGDACGLHIRAARSVVLAPPHCIPTLRIIADNGCSYTVMATSTRFYRHAYMMLPMRPSCRCVLPF